MSDLVVIEYDDEYKALEVRIKLLKLQSEYLIVMDDAVVAVKNADGKVKLHQPVNLTAVGAARGGLWGSLIGLMFLNPLLGAAVGAASGALTDIGVNNEFMKKIADGFKPGTSALFVLVREATPDKVMDEIKGYGGTVLQTSLTHEKEEKLQAALNEARSGTAV